MNDLVRLVDEYKIFNYLVPGIITSFSLGDGTFYEKIAKQDVLVEFFMLYFVGLVASRLGSLFVDGILRKTKIVQFVDYGDYIEAAKRDDKIVKFSQENNMYRTFVATFAVVLIVNFGYRVFGNNLTTGRESLVCLLGTLGILALMVFSYKKQTGYVVKRINHSSK